MGIRKSRVLSLGDDSIYRIFGHFAIPSILSMLAQTTAGLVDSIFIGRFVGPEGIGGITLFFPVLNLLVGFSSMIAIGGVTLAGIHSGRKETDTANNYFNVTIILVIIFSIFSTFITWILADIGFLEGRLGLGPATAILTSEYARVLTWFYVPFLVNFTLSLFVKLAGRPVIVVAANLAGAVMNILLDWLLVGKAGMGMTGAAMATGLSQVLPCLILLVVLIARTDWHFTRPRFRGKEIGALLFNGSSEFLTMASLAISGFIYNWVILRTIGEAGVSAYGIALQAGYFMVMLFYGIAEAIQSPVSFNFGANRIDRVEKLRRLSTGTVAAIGILLFPPLFFRGHLLAGIFTTHAPTVEMAGLVLRFFALSFLTAGVNIVATSYYTAINQPVISASLAVLRSLMAILIGLAIFPALIPGRGLWIPMVFTEVVTFVAVVFLYVLRPLGLKKDRELHAATKRDQ